MSTLEVSPVEPLSGQSSHAVINDFSIQVATVNGSGSQTANSVLMRSIFQMGIPVSGKNMFPSNIAGLPTWFTIRASKHGYIGRRKEVDFLVAMNPETAREDVMKLDSGAAVVYDAPLKLSELRSDLHFYPVPFDKLVAPVCPDAKLRKLVRNMIYDGIVVLAAGHRDGRDPPGAGQTVRQAQGQSRRAELGRRQGRFRIRRQKLHQDRSLPRRAHERNRRQDHHRRQLRLRPGRHVRRRAPW